MEHIQLKNEVPDAVKAITGGIAHDFNILLSEIKSRASLMMNSVEQSDPLYQHIKEIINSIDKGSEMVNLLRCFAKMNEYYTSSIDINRLVRNIVENLDMKGKKIVLDVDLDPKALIVEADPDKINQVLASIIDNAMDAMPKGGKLSISTESAVILNGTADAYGLSTGLFVKITIIDTGIGMEKGQLESIFKPFYSTDNNSYPTKKGLGLTFAREIVENHDGVIDVRSYPNTGSSFSVILPLKQAIDDFGIPAGDENSGLWMESILLVDDDKKTLKVGSKICKSLGYSVITADSGKKAISNYKKKKDRISLVILDMRMPEMNGLETFIELKKLNPDIKVLLSTGYSIDEKAQEMLKRGCKGYLLKPYNAIELSHKLKEILFM